MARRTSRARRSPPTRWLFRWPRGIFLRFLVVLIPLALFGLIVSIYAYTQLSQMITLGVEGKRWSLSSKVYAEPVSLYPGLPLRIDDLHVSLERLGYRPVQSVSARGEYRVNAPHVEIALHDFHYAYRLVRGRAIRVTFKGNTVREVRDLRRDQAISAVDLEPELVSEFFAPEREKRRLVTFAEIPKHLIYALIAVEDRRFYEHRGIDWIGILRALYRNLRAREVTEGGSTITQQLVKNFFLTPARSIWRKLAEMAMAVLVEARYSKAAILELYLNEIYLGQRGSISINGIGEAARLYFRKEAKALSIEDAALLVGLIRAPTPIRLHPGSPRRPQLHREPVQSGDASSAPGGVGL